MTTSPVLSVTDELLAELEDAASKATPQHLDSAEDVIMADSGAMIECPVCGGEGYASLENEYCNFDNHAIGVQFYGIGPEFGAAEEYYRRANPATITALTAELRRLRAENAGLAQSLAESRANDQAAMGWLTSLRWASGDRGERMLPELVTHIEGLAKDAGRYRWIAKLSTYGIDCRQRPSLTLPIYAPDHIDSLGYSIDTAMAAQ